MRLMKGKSKDPTYHVIKDVRRNGKRSSEIVENLGHADEICKKYNVTDADAWAKEYIRKLNEDEAAKDHNELSCYEQSRGLMEPPKFELHQIYRALSVISENSDIIQAELYKRSKKIIKRSTGVTSNE